MNVAMKDRLARDNPDVRPNIEALNGSVVSQNLRTKAAQQVIRRRDFLRREVKVGRRMAQRQHERVKASDWRGVTQRERKLVAHHHGV